MISFSAELNPVVPITILQPSLRHISILARVTAGRVKSINTEPFDKAASRLSSIFTPTRPTPESSPASRLR